MSLLRRGRIHAVADPARDPACAHAGLGQHEGGSPSLCVPLIVQADLIGLLWIAFRPGTPVSGEKHGKRQLAVALAEQIALALSNIKLRENLRQQTIRDPLTGLYNRRFLEESLTREMARCKRSQSGFGILMMDLDHFKRFNDTFGHEAGDVVLRSFAQSLQRSTREADIACRFGGEEFVVVLPDTGQQGAATRAEQILAAVRTMQVTHNDQALGPITISIGLAMYPQHGETVKCLIRSADKALYEAKGAGRDRLVVATNEEKKALARTRLRQARIATEMMRPWQHSRG